MPELPEVETIRRGLAPHVEGAVIKKVILRRPDLRFPFPPHMAERLQGQTIVGLTRRAKYLLFALSGGETLLSHLGMTGNYRFSDAGIDQTSRGDAGDVSGKHDHLILELERDGKRFLLIYSDPRRFGFFDLFTDPAKCKHLIGLGPEPLGNELNAPALARRLAGRKSAIKTALLDQSIIAGLGNIYVCEALWRASIAPTRPAGKLVTARGEPKPDLEGLVGAIRAVLEEAIAAGGSTLRDFRNADGETGYFQFNFDVYGREGEPCRKPGCAGIIARRVQSGRSSFYCPVCQRK